MLPSRIYFTDENIKLMDYLTDDNRAGVKYSTGEKKETLRKVFTTLSTYIDIVNKNGLDIYLFNKMKW